MSVAAVIPVKALDSAKQRLSAALDPHARARLVLWLLERVIGAVRDSAAVDALAVVSPDADVLARALELGATPLRQDGGNLNAGLDLGREWALRQRATALLALLGDLPLLRGAELREMVARGFAPAGAGRGGAVLAPDRAGTGTNALLLRPPSCLPFAFGAGSRARHQALARRQGVALELYHATGTAFDVDRAADLDELWAGGCGAADARPPAIEPRPPGTPPVIISGAPGQGMCRDDTGRESA